MIGNAVFSFKVGDKFRRIYLDRRKYTQRVISGYLNKGELYERGTVECLKRLLGKGDVFVNVGAHVGYMSLVGEALGAEVIAFEPDIDNYGQFISNMGLNGVWIEIHNVAIGLKAGEQKFYVNSDNDGGHALWDIGRHSFNEKTREEKVVREVEVRALNGIKAKVIKIDTEGAEFDVLQNVGNVPYIICEINRFGLKQMGSSEDELRDYMEGRGYKAQVIIDMEPYLMDLPPDKVVLNEEVFNILFSNI